MASVNKINGQPRLRYRISFPLDSVPAWADRSRRCQTVAEARKLLAIAQDIEYKTRYSDQRREDIEHWRRYRLISEADAERLGYKTESKLFIDAIEEWKRTWRDSLSEGELAGRDWALKHILKNIPAETSIKDITYKDAIRLKETLVSCGLKTTSIRKVISAARKIMKHQVNIETIRANPFDSITIDRGTTEDKPKGQFIPAERMGQILELAKYENTCKRQIYLIILMGYGTGIRRGALIQTRWDMIDWERRLINLPAEIVKTSTARQVGLGAALYEELSKKRKNTGLIFPGIKKTTITESFAKICRKLGYNYTFHHLRHTYATMIQDVGAKPHEAMQRTGHSDMGMLSHYSHSQVSEILEDQFEFMKVPEIKEEGEA